MITNLTRSSHIFKTILQLKPLRHPLRSLVPLQTLQTAANMACKEVSKLSDVEVAEWFNSFDTVMTDCDGVLWVGAEAIPGSPDMVQRFRELGKRVFYVTNNSTKHRKEYKTKVDKLGFGGDLEEIVGTAYLAAAYLEQVGFDKNKLVYVVGSTGITQELDDVGIKYLPIGVSSSISLKDQVLTGVKDLDLERIGALVFGISIELNYKDLMLCNVVLANPDCLFLLDMPDETFKARTDSATMVYLPCNVTKFTLPSFFRILIET